jgi:hypothetical protein
MLVIKSHYCHILKIYILEAFHPFIRLCIQSSFVKLYKTFAWVWGIGIDCLHMDFEAHKIFQSFITMTRGIFVFDQGFI